jgi:hypothetical protein
MFIYIITHISIIINKNREKTLNEFSVFEEKNEVLLFTYVLDKVFVKIITLFWSSC